MLSWSLSREDVFRKIASMMASKSNSPRLNPGTHTAKGQNRIPQIVLAGHGTCADTHTYTYK